MAKNTLCYQFFIYGPQHNLFCIFGYSGGPGWPINNRTGKQSNKDFLSYGENDEMSADAAADAAADTFWRCGSVMTTKP